MKLKLIVQLPNGPVELAEFDTLEQLALFAAAWHRGYDMGRFLEYYNQAPKSDALQYTLVQPDGSEGVFRLTTNTTACVACAARMPCEERAQCTQCGYDGHAFHACEIFNE